MASVEDKLAISLTAESTELIPYFSYLLQDLWELGSSPNDIIELTVKHIDVSEQTKVLDLACGKGAISVHFAKAFGCNVKGIDLIPEFIEYATQKAQEFGVENLCEFQVGDINQAVEKERDYDIVILGAVGTVLGSPEETVMKLKKIINDKGYIFVDDAYGVDDSDIRCPSKSKWLSIFNNAGLRLIDEKLIAHDELCSINIEQQALIVKRANELMNLYPEKASLFESYIRSQQAECDELENEISGVTMLLQNEKP